MHLYESHSRHGMTEVAASDLDLQLVCAHTCVCLAAWYAQHVTVAGIRFFSMHDRCMRHAPCTPVWLRPIIAVHKFMLARLTRYVLQALRVCILSPGLRSGLLATRMLASYAGLCSLLDSRPSSSGQCLIVFNTWLGGCRQGLFGCMLCQCTVCECMSSNFTCLQIVRNKQGLLWP
jgi:hypothetical protein